MSGRPLLLALYLAAALLAFGGIYAWAVAPLFAGAVLLAAFTRGAWSTKETRALDGWLSACAGAIGLQLVPLPASVRTTLSPHAGTVDAVLRPDAAIRDVGAGPLSLAPAATGDALLLVIAVVLTYLTARRIFSDGGVRRLCHVLAIVAALAAVAALAQRALAPTRIYGFWTPTDAGAMPFGPVVNRNHFAGWLLMASAVTAGYLVARLMVRMPAMGAAAQLRLTTLTLTQSSLVWTALQWAAMTATLFASYSRSAILGLLVAAVAFARGAGRGWRPALALGGVAAAVGVLLLVAGESTATVIAERFAGTLTAAEISRRQIWRETLAMIADFPIAGVGAGAYGHAVLAYQQTHVFVPHLGMTWHFNHAHNHFLQVVVEGGLLLTIPAGVTVFLFARLAQRRLREDHGELRYVRLGALAGLAGIATQSIWEVPLTMPAAALLAATLAALVTFRRADSTPAPTRQRS